MDFLDFSTELIDADGDKVVVDTAADTVSEVARFLKCTKKRALETLSELTKKYDVYSNPEQIIIASGGKVLYNFEMFGMTSRHGHKYNNLGIWDFRYFVKYGRLKKKKKSVYKPMEIKLSVTEMQLMRTQQLWYAHTVGFNIGYADYKRFYLVS